MTEYEKLKTQLSELLGEGATKEQIEKVALIGKFVDDLATKASKQEADYKTLLKDYSDLVKNSAFKVDNKSTVDEGLKSSKPVDFESFMNSWAEKNIKDK